MPPKTKADTNLLAAAMETTVCVLLRIFVCMCVCVCMFGQCLPPLSHVGQGGRGGKRRQQGVSCQPQTIHRHTHPLIIENVQEEKEATVQAQNLVSRSTKPKPCSMKLSRKDEEREEKK